MFIQSEYSRLIENDIMNDGERSLYSIRSEEKKRLPWDEAGAPGLRRDMTINDLMRNEHLNWDVSMEPIWVHPPRHPDFIGEHGLIKVPNRYAVQRMDTGKPLGVVSSRYEIIQNIDVMQWFRPLFDSGLCEFESAGNFQDGKKCWFMVKMYKKPLMAVKDDPILPYLMFQYGFDGKTSIQIHPVSIRLDCLNQMSVVNEDAKKFGVKIQHTKSVRKAMESIQEATVQAHQSMKDTEKILKKFVAKKINQESLERYFKNYLKIPYRSFSQIKNANEELQQQMQREKEKLEELFQAYQIEDRSMSPLAKGTLYHAYNAVTRLLTHTRISNSSERHWYSLTNGTRASDHRRAMKYAINSL